jgi:surface antigen
MLAGALGYTTTPHSLSTQKDFAAGGSLTSESLTNAAPVASLTGGPSGQLLPPGSMAADHTFANHYAWGQCTWYVAGRRQVPAGWGNAASWYYHAVSSSWHVGTVPAQAAIAWTPAGAFGHVALVEQVSGDGNSVYISEMNYRAVGVKSYRWVPASSFKYIY